MQRLSEIRLDLPPVVDGRIARYRERVDRVRGDVEGADIDTLIRCHDRLLSIAPHIRVGTKWGRYTTYTVKIKDRDAVALTAGALKLRGHGADNHRIEFGANAKGEPHARLEFWEPAPVHDWDTWDDPEVPARVWEWLDTYQPAARILLDIDNHLLRLQLANAVSRPPPFPVLLGRSLRCHKKNTHTGGKTLGIHLAWVLSLCRIPPIWGKVSREYEPCKKKLRNGWRVILIWPDSARPSEPSAEGAACE